MGLNQYGQLGDGTTSSTDVPIPINLGQGVHLNTVVGICGGGRHSLAVLCNDRGVHEIHAFGRGDDGQLGLSDISSHRHPNKIATSRLGNTVLAISAGWSHLWLCSRVCPRFNVNPHFFRRHRV